MSQQPKEAASLVTTPRVMHHRGATSNQLENLAAAIEALTMAVSQMVRQDAPSAKMLTYEEVAAITRFKQTKLEDMVRLGRFQEGRHYIKEGGVRFHPDLLRLMFEDKRAIEEEVTPEEVQQQRPARTPNRNKPGRETAINLGYLDGGSR